MISVFDTEKLRDLLKDFYRITNIRTAVFDADRTQLVAYPEQLVDFCEIIRSCEKGRRACAQCDQSACERAAKSRKLQIYQCHAGLTEAVAPLLVDDVLVGYLLFGHMFCYPDHETGWLQIQRLCSNLPIEQELLRRSSMERPISSKEDARSAAHILLAVASYLILEHLAMIQQEPLSMKLDHYLNDHYTEDVKTAALCKALNIGKTQLYKLAKELYGCGITEHIRDLRIVLAKDLLEHGGDLSLEQIAARCGYHDYNYFISVFSREVGCPPGVWRRKNA